MRKILKSDWIGPVLRQYRWGLGLAIFLGTLTMLCAGLLMFSAGYVISKAATHPINILMIYVPVLFVRIFGISRPTIRYIERLTSHNWILRITSDLRRKLYLRLETRAIQLAQEFKLGEFLGLLNEDIANLQDLYLRTLFPILIAGSLSVALVISAGVFSLTFALGLAVILAVLLIVVPWLSVKRTKKLDERLKTFRNQLYTELTDDVLGLTDWVLSGRQADFLSVHEKAQRAVRKEQQQLFSFARKRNLLLQVIFGLLVVYLMAWSGSVLHGGDAPNYIAAVVLAIFPLFDAYNPLSDAMVETNRYADSAHRLDELPQENDKKQSPTAQTQSALTALEDKVSVQPYPHNPATPLSTDSTIVLSELSFAFDEHLIFDKLDLSIPSGEHVAILGRSGVGKSTLASLIRGDLVPQSGSVQVGGQDSSQISAIEKKIGVINQSPYLFATSLRNNLTLGKLEASDDEIWEALKIVGLTDRIHQLPQELDEPVDEAGARFSGGERQRLALARILLSDVEIVILDEPTVSLDPITEYQLLTLFLEALKDKTILLITHHLLGVDQLDRVIFLENGTLKIDGAPEQLLENNPIFHRLYQLDRGLTISH